MSEIILPSKVTSFHGFSSGEEPSEYAVSLSIFMSMGIMSGNASTAVNEAFCEVFMAIEEIKVSWTDNPIQARSPVTRNQPGRVK